MRLFWYDSETTGRDSKDHQMLTFAIVCTDLQKNIIAQLYLKVRLLPSVTPDAEALRINQIDPTTLEWFAESIEEKNLCEQIISFYNEHSDKEGNAWLAYNARFDNSFLQSAFDRSGLELNLEKDVCVDPFLMCKEATSKNKIITPEKIGRDKKSYRSSTLVDVSKALNTSHEGDAHNALNDVLCLIKTTPKAFEKLTGNDCLATFIATEKYQISF